MPEPDWMMIAIGAAVGAVLIAVPLWLLLAGRARTREGVLDERLTAAEARATELKQALDEAGRREQAIVDARASEAALRAAAEEKTRRIPQLERELEERARLLDALRIEVSNLRSAQAELNERLAQEQKNAQEKLRLLDDARSQLADAFKALSSDALKHNNQSFVTLARETLEKFQQGARDDLGQRQLAIEQLTKPIRESLEKVDHRIVDLEKAREGAYRSLEQQVKSLLDHHLPRLHKETADLVKALRQPTARGRWGEMQLRRVVEMAGMLEHCDFSEQQNVATEGGRLRPDLIVRLPGGRQIVVDAKAPVDAYLSAVEADDEAERQNQLVRHARQLRTHIEQLGRKSYFEQFEPTPEFVVLFVPGEAFFSAALAQDANLIEYGTEQHVIPASPTTLIALLKAVAYGWRQEAVAANAAQVAALGKELYERISKVAEHWSKLGRNLGNAVGAFNDATASLESRVLVSARRFADLRAASDGKPLPELAPVDHAVRQLQAPEMQAGDHDEDEQV